MAEVGQAMDEMLILLFASLVAGIGCWFAAYGMYVAWAKGIAAWRRRRTEAARRAEIVRGLADIERFLEAHAARPLPGEPPDSSGTSPGS
jgi:F0F1-type ATP synthase membrane subunit c/vacuolar-type H+-ATPase subunit K